jgi:hypothetical protein
MSVVEGNGKTTVVITVTVVSALGATNVVENTVVVTVAVTILGLKIVVVTVTVFVTVTSARFPLPLMPSPDQLSCSGIAISVTGLDVVIRRRRDGTDNGKV